MVYGHLQPVNLLRLVMGKSDTSREQNLVQKCEVKEGKATKLQLAKATKIFLQEQKSIMKGK